MRRNLVTMPRTEGVARARERAEPYEDAFDRRVCAIAEHVIIDALDEVESARISHAAAHLTCWVMIVAAYALGARPHIAVSTIIAYVTILTLCVMHRTCVASFTEAYTGFWCSPHHAVMLGCAGKRFVAPSRALLYTEWIRMQNERVPPPEINACVALLCERWARHVLRIKG